MLPVLLVAVASLLAVGAVHFRVATTRTRLQIEGRLQGVVGVVAGRNFPFTDPVLRQMAGLADAEFVLTDAGGSLLASSGPASVPGGKTGGRPASRIEQVVLGSPVRMEGKDYFYSSLWVEPRAQTTSPGVLHILFPRDEYNAAWRSAFAPPVLVGAAMVVAVVSVIHWVAARIGRTLHSLGDEVKRLAEGDFSDIGWPKWNDETMDLAVAVQQTAGKLEAYEEEIRRTERMQTVAVLTAGLAHEMRNAATGCRMAVDLHAECCPNGAGDESLEVAKRQLFMMEDRLRQLLRLGKPSSAAEVREIDFCGLVDRLVSLVRPAARHAEVCLHWQAPACAIRVRADEQQIGQAVMNVLLNAVDAARRSTARTGRTASVCVEVSTGEGASTLVVSDSGDGPSADMEKRMFEPFVTDKREGVGLGLAVARRVVEIHGGEVVWERSSGRTRFSLNLPLSAGSQHVENTGCR
jgi:signal transduction histidine kinase